MSEEIEKAFKGQAPGYSKHVGYTRYVNGKAIRVEGGAQPHQKVTLAAPGSVKHKGGEFLDRLHSYVHKKAPTTEHELQEAVHRFVHGKFEGDEKALQKFHAEGLKELSKHGLVTHHEPKAKRDEEKVDPKKDLRQSAQDKRNEKFAKDNEDKTGLRPKLPGWDYHEGSKIQAPLSTKDDYVISHRRLQGGKEQHNVSYRPTGKHEHVGEYQNAKEAVAAADAHAASLKKKPRKEAPHPADQELAERKKEKPGTATPTKPDLLAEQRNLIEVRGFGREFGWKNETGSTIVSPDGKRRIVIGNGISLQVNENGKWVRTKHDPETAEIKQWMTPATEKPKGAEPEKALPKIPSFEDASHKRLSKLAEHPKAKKKAIAALAERIASKPEDATHADLHAELSALEQRHGIEPTTEPKEIGYHEPAVQRAMSAFPNYQALEYAVHQHDTAPHAKANALEAARRLKAGEKPSKTHPAIAAKPAPKAEEKPATSTAALKIGKFDEGSVRYLVEHMSESELRSRLPQASDSIKNNVNEALRRIAEKKEEKTS